jgi:hypothetical protein
MEFWETYPGSDEDGIAIALPEGTEEAEASREEVSEGIEEVVTLHTTPLGGQVEVVEINQGPQYMYQHLRYMKILRDAPDVIEL